MARGKQLDGLLADLVIQGFRKLQSLGHWNEMFPCKSTSPSRQTKVYLARFVFEIVGARPS